MLLATTLSKTRAGRRDLRWTRLDVWPGSCLSVACHGDWALYGVWRNNSGRTLPRRCQHRLLRCTLSGGTSSDLPTYTPTVDRRIGSGLFARSCKNAGPAADEPPSPHTPPPCDSRQTATRSKTTPRPAPSIAAVSLAVLSTPSSPPSPEPKTGRPPRWQPGTAAGPCWAVR